MAPFLVFALALLGADDPSTTPAEPAAPPAAAAPAAPAPDTMGSSPVSAPTDDYGYVAWCYGAISAYVDLYDKAMPEVIRIERAWPTPDTEENINEVYPGQKKESLAELKLFRRAMTAAEKASAQPIQDRGAAAIKRGRAVWAGADSVKPAQLAQFWMSWSPPAKCEETAKSLEKKSKLFGQALTYNSGEEPEAKPADAAPPADAAAASPPADAAAPAADSAAGDVMTGLAEGASPAPVAAPEPTPDAAVSAADAPAADADKPPESTSEAPPASPVLEPSLEPLVVTDPPTSADLTSIPDTIAPAPKGDAPSATGFKPRKKKPALRGPQ